MGGGVSVSDLGCGAGLGGEGFTNNSVIYSVSGSNIGLGLLLLCNAYFCLYFFS